MNTFAEAFRGDGEILANPIGTIPIIGGRLARASFEPDVMMTDGEARLVAGERAVDGDRADRPGRWTSEAGTRTDACSTWSGRAGAT